MRIAKRIEWSMGHRLANHDGKCRNLHGHRYELEVVIDGKVDRRKNAASRGMVVDFGEVKKMMDEYVHDLCDHAFMVAEDDAVIMEFFKKNADLKHVVVPFDTTAENIARWIFASLKKEVTKLGSGVRLYSVQLWETPYNWALVEEE